MSHKKIITLGAVGTMLVLAAGIIRGFNVWSTTMNYVVPWLCAATGVALLFACAIVTICQGAGSLVKPRVLVGGIVVLGVFGGVLGLNILVHELMWEMAIGEWLAFATLFSAILGALPLSGPDGCHACGYNLTGNKSGRCPECGAEVRRDGGSEAGA